MGGALTNATPTFIRPLPWWVIMFGSIPTRRPWRAGRFNKSNRKANSELAYLEETIASAVCIVQRVKALAYWLDHPDELALALEILRQAQAIRQRTIEWMAERKAEKGE